MCAGFEGLTMAQGVQMGGEALGGISSALYANAQATQARADARTERDAAQQQAESILRATERRRGAARAATAASGAKIDEFSLGVERDIEEAGFTDAAMTVLSGDRRARSLQSAARTQQAAGMGALGSSLLSASYIGWKGAKGKADPAFSRYTDGFMGSGD